jgi:hypothetical protein
MLGKKRIQSRIKAAEGDANKLLNLGLDYARGTGGLSRDIERALHYYHRSAELGNSHAMFNIGACHLKGDTPTQKADYDLAYDWLEKAADERSADAEFGLHEVYKLGLGVEKDLEEAYYWLKRAQKHARRLEPGSEIDDLVERNMQRQWVVDVRRRITLRKQRARNAKLLAAKEAKRDQKIRRKAARDARERGARGSETLSPRHHVTRQETKSHGIIFRKTASSQGSRSASRNGGSSAGRKSSKPRKKSSDGHQEEDDCSTEDKSTLASSRGKRRSQMSRASSHRESKALARSRRTGEMLSRASSGAPKDVLEGAKSKSRTGDVAAKLASTRIDEEYLGGREAFDV